ncbi:MAG: hypothetical protein NTW31_03450 [Bacteroidetes bacterium]|nr:hypothetical protein [Bacteroidota bacterium]
MLKRRVFPVIFLNSLFYFLCAYFILFLISRISVAVSASAFSIPVRIYYNKTDFLVRSSDWASDSVTAVFGTGPLLCLILGLVLLIIFIRVATESGMLRILLIWLAILAIVSFLGEIIVGALMNQGFGYVIMYMFIMDTGKLVLTLLGGILLFFAGVALSRTLLFTANIYLTDIKGLEKTRFVIYQYVFPYLAGIFLLQIIELPGISWFPTLVRLCGIIFLLPVLSRSASIQDIYFEEEIPEFTISWNAAFAALALIMVYRVLFGFGVKFAL